MVKNSGYSNLDSAERLFHCSSARGKHLLSFYTLDHRPFVAVPSIVPVNINKGVRVASKPDNQI